MAISQGTFGRLREFEDFLSIGKANAAWAETGLGMVGKIMFTSVNEGSFAQTVDEPGGILAVTTDTADDDNWCGYLGPFKPADGGCWMEARVKLANVTTTTSLYVGFTETLSATTPVMPAEFATATMTYNGTGGMVGLQFDIDGTTDDWRAVGGDAAAKSGDADANGTRAYQAPVADEWDVIRVEIDPNGRGRVYLATKDDAGKLKLIKDVGVAVNPADVQHAVVFVENRTAAAVVLEIDYFAVNGSRDWTR